MAAGLRMDCREQGREPGPPQLSRQGSMVAWPGVVAAEELRSRQIQGHFGARADRLC